MDTGKQQITPCNGKHFADTGYTPLGTEAHLRIGYWSLCVNPDGIQSQYCHWPYGRHGKSGHWACRDKHYFFCAQDDCPNTCNKELLIIEAIVLYPNLEDMFRFDKREQAEFEDYALDSCVGGLRTFREWWLGRKSYL